MYVLVWRENALARAIGKFFFISERNWESFLDTFLLELFMLLFNWKITASVTYKDQKCSHNIRFTLLASFNRQLAFYSDLRKQKLMLSDCWIVMIDVVKVFKVFEKCRFFIHRFPFFKCFNFWYSVKMCSKRFKFR